MNRYRYRSTKNQKQENAHDDDQSHHHQVLRRQKRTKIALIRNHGIILLLFVVLVCIYTPPTNTTHFSRSESIENDKKKIITAVAEVAAAKSSSTLTSTTIVACDVSTPHDNVDVAEGTLRITIQNDNHDSNSIHIHRKGSSAEAFMKLVDAKFYDSTYTFRVIKGFVVQWGFRGTQSSDNNGGGDGDRTIIDAASKRIREADTNISSSIHKDQDSNDVNNNGLLSNVRGTITMISGPTGQVFINLGNNARLDKEGTIPFGVLDEESMILADKIYTGYKGGQGQIKAINSNKIPTQFPKMNRIESCYRVE